MSRTIDFTLNGAGVSVAAEPPTSLLESLRGPLETFGARFGCGSGQCGACAVLIDGAEEASCLVSLGAAEGRSVTTVEGLGSPAAPHPLQTAFLELQAGQCGYCLSGILIGAKALLDRNPDPTRAEVAQALSWHLCRCGVHNRVMDAVLLAARRMREGVAA
jgi:nicotinate dehydrogenase subunit A